MGFWIFMMIMNSLIPITMLGFGCYFKKNAPKEINHAFGYRTKSSMKNRDTWEFAHYYSGKLWQRIGLALLIVSVIAMLFAVGKSENVVGAFGGILSGVQLIFLIGSIFPTEIA